MESSAKEASLWLPTRCLLSPSSAPDARRDMKTCAHQHSRGQSNSAVALQVKFSVLERAPLQNGLRQACSDLGVTLVAHSPLSQGLLTGAARSPPTQTTATMRLLGADGWVCLQTSM